MTVTEVTKDPDLLTMSITSTFDVPLQRVWQIWADPRQLEKWWGPPTWPATFVQHDFVPGGRARYFMTGPEGEKAYGWWTFLRIEEPHELEIDDGFGNDDGSPNTDLPTMHMLMALEATESGTSMRITTTFANQEQMQQILDMGAEEGMKQAMGQIEDVLADLASFAVGRATEAQILDDTHVRVSRVIRGSVEQVWDAHHDSELMQKWLLGPDGWTMPVCEVPEKVGGSYRYEWESEDGEQRFGFEGELLERNAPRREVTTERMIGMEGEGTVNELTLRPVEGGTLLTVTITYPNAEVRDIVLATGMVDGMETSYARLEDVVLN
jgi:uncharacterized protein YndB with AHSA1/START domain